MGAIRINQTTRLKMRENKRVREFIGHGKTHNEIIGEQRECMEIKQEEDVSNLQPYVGKHSEVLEDREQRQGDLSATCIDEVSISTPDSYI
jgi:hypothetical protein